jgi:restriction system protein
VPRSDFQEDLLYSLGAFMTVCQIRRNQAVARFTAVLNGREDPGPTETPAGNRQASSEVPTAETHALDIGRTAHDQILQYIAGHFPRHAFSRLVDAILRTEGFTTQVSDPGPDGGVDILAARGSLGFDGPHLCVQVKSSKKPEDVTTLRALQGTMQTFKATQGLLVSWGGFTRAVYREARQSYFHVRLWSASDVVEAIYRVYERLHEEIQAELPLKRVWALVLEESDQ